MIPGEIFSAPGTVTLNAGIPAITVMVANTGDRPVQVGSHYHFAETNPALEFDRAAAQGMRLDIASGTAVRFEPGQRREVNLIPVGGARRIFGFNGKVMGPLALILALSFPQISEAQTAAECAEPMTQQLMNACAAKDFAEADAALNDAWKPAFARAKEIDQGDALLAAQRAWITYRDLACEVHSSPMAGGSMRPLMQYICLDELTENRTKLLQEFLVY